MYENLGEYIYWNACSKLLFTDKVVTWHPVDTSVFLSRTDISVSYCVWCSTRHRHRYWHDIGVRVQVEFDVFNISVFVLYLMFVSVLMLNRCFSLAVSATCCYLLHSLLLKNECLSRVIIHWVRTNKFCSEIRVL